MKRIWPVLFGLLLVVMPVVVHAQFEYATNADGTSLTITKYTGDGGDVTVPTNYDGLTVTGIGDNAFEKSGLTSVTIPDSVTNIGDLAFHLCSDLTSITMPSSVTNIGPDALHSCPALSNAYFAGSAPTVFSDVLANTNAIAYYLPGTAGWPAFSAQTGVPSVLWNPLIQPSAANFGILNNQFGFTITNAGTTNIPIVIEACTNLANASWTPLLSLTLTNSFYFSDPQWTNYPNRFYAIGFP